MDKVEENIIKKVKDQAVKGELYAYMRKQDKINKDMFKAIKMIAEPINQIKNGIGLR